MSRRWLLVSLGLAVACGPRGEPTAPAPAGPTPADRAFEAAAATFFEAHLAFRPQLAIELGRHDLDGRVADRSLPAIAAELARLDEDLARFTAIDPATLSPDRALDRDVLLAEIRKERFDLAVRRRPWRDPFYYLRGYSLLPYLARPYAPLPERVQGMLAACEGGAGYFAQAAANLEPSLPRPWLQAGLMISQGAADFAGKDARAALAELPAADAELATRTGACLDRLVAAIGDFRGALTARMPAASDDFRLGADALLAMLREAEGIDVDVATLERVAHADLERNRAALAAAARAIDPTRDVAAVVADVTDDKPAPDRVLELATSQLAQLHRFVVEHDLVSVPRDDRAEVRESPRFMRGNFAALGGVGPFETTPLPSFFYVAPPDPAWPPAEQRAYLPSRSDLLFVTAHEVWPGHFIQGMHQRASDSPYLKAFETYTASEGWAHYVEEMMWDAGLGDGDPRVHLGQLKNALLRDVRFLVALGYHTGTMTLDEATALFQREAFADPGNARQQALRGTIDPMFLGYTLGKLIIMKMAADWQARGRGTLREFHDAFLRRGEAPLAGTRRALLGPDAGPLL